MLPLDDFEQYNWHILPWKKADFVIKMGEYI